MGSRGPRGRQVTEWISGPWPRFRAPPSLQTATSSSTMTSPRRPLSTPPVGPARPDWEGYYPNPGLPGGFPDVYPYGTPYMSPYPYRPIPSPPPPATPEYEVPSATLRGGTLLHKGFYDLLSLIPSIPSTPPSRLFWPARSQSPEHELIPGPRYEEIPGNGAPKPPAPASPVASPAPRNLKARRISKDMVSKPTGFMYVPYTYYSRDK